LPSEEIDEPETETLEVPAATSKKRLKRTIEVEEENRNPNPASKKATDQLKKPAEEFKSKPQTLQK
jgi:hypothetical protein